MSGAEDGGFVGPSPSDSMISPAAPVLSENGVISSGVPFLGDADDANMGDAGGSNVPVNDDTMQGPMPLLAAGPHTTETPGLDADDDLGEANDDGPPVFWPSGTATNTYTALYNAYASHSSHVLAAQQIQQAQQNQQQQQHHPDAVFPTDISMTWTQFAQFLFQPPGTDASFQESLQQLMAHIAGVSQMDNGQDVSAMSTTDNLANTTTTTTTINNNNNYNDANYYPNGDLATAFTEQQTAPAEAAGSGDGGPTALPQPPLVFQNPLAALQYNNLNPTNYNLRNFLANWAWTTHVNARVSSEPKQPHILSDHGIKSQINKAVNRVRYEDLKGDHCDFQGIDWTKMGVSRQQARERRMKTFLNYVSVQASDRWKPAPNELMPPNTDTYFRFRKMHMKKEIHLAHFQLRNLLATASKSRAFYADRRGIVRHFNTLTGVDNVALRFAEHSEVQISTIAAGQGALVAGGFGGEYCITNIDSEYLDEKPYATRSEGTVTSDQASGISNHIEIHSLRSAAGPLAAFASNDLGLRVLDLNTQVVLSDVRFSFALNCTAISPDRRLRVVVGDATDAFIVAAEPERSIIDSDGTQRPDVLQRLSGHRDFGFACAWADDGYTLATGNQDRAIKIWDARKWCNSSKLSTPVATLRTEMAGARSLHFSPAGSGKRVLIAVEEADIISIIDGQTFRTRQAFDLFGEIAGVSLTNNGQDMLALCADSSRGGLVQFERCGLEAAAVNYDESYDPNPRELRWRGAASFDWPDSTGESYQKRQRVMRRRLRSAAVASLEPF